ncbi:MAG TPA: nitrate- and nitrite sensing domain-containing protein, partial [Spirochaetales bacterium]|nr:nitrate- and nitrite sensing domain-containing protein [Spirochaetales bacterium]
MLVLIAVPLAMVAAMGAMLILSSMGDKGEIDDAESNLTIMKSLSSLLSAAQDERGIAYLYLSGTAAADRIMSTRNGTGSSWETVQAALAAVPAPESLETVLTSSVARFQQLRRQVDEHSMMAQSAYTGYSELIDLVMAEYVALSATNAAEASRQLQSIVYLEKAKENAARIQCLASSIFSLDLAIQYTKTIELVDTNAGIVVNLANAGEYCGELASVSLSELEISPEWYELQDAVLSILGNAQYGGYGRDGLAFYNATEPVMDKIQATIDIVMAETDAWFAERS